LCDSESAAQEVIAGADTGVAGLPQMKLSARLFALAVVVSLPTACAAPVSRDAVPVMRWDHRPEAKIWTERTITAVEQRGDVLTSLVPKDIDTWCPGYATADLEDRRAFWAGLFSALAKHESTWNPVAEGGGGLWIGLTQIDPRTARAYGCSAQSASALKDGGDNLSCAIRIASVQVPKDNMVSGPQGRHGVGRDWGPMRSAEKRAEMAAWTRSQSYCQPKDTSVWAALGAMSVTVSTKGAAVWADLAVVPPTDGAQ